eukprot:5796024-Pyramimonas_sp.AAC.1
MLDVAGSQPQPPSPPQRIAPTAFQYMMMVTNTDANGNNNGRGRGTGVCGGDDQVMLSMGFAGEVGTMPNSSGPIAKPSVRIADARPAVPKTPPLSSFPQTNFLVPRPPAQAPPARLLHQSPDVQSQTPASVSKANVSSKAPFQGTFKPF